MSDRHVVMVVAVVALAIAAIALGGIGAGMYSTHQFVVGGYHECAVPGHNGAAWCK